MDTFDNLGSALQLLGCTPVHSEQQWAKPTPKYRITRSPLQQSSTESIALEARTDPYQLLDISTQSEQLSVQQAHPVTENSCPSNSESSFEVVTGAVPHSRRPPAASSGGSDQESSAVLPVVCSQSSCASLPLGQKTVVRPTVPLAFPRLSEPTRRPLSLRMPSAPAVRRSPKPKFSRLDFSFAPLQRPVPLRAADYHRPRPLLPPCQGVKIPAVQPSSVLSPHLASSKKSPTWMRPGEHNSRSVRHGVCTQQGRTCKGSCKCVEALVKTQANPARQLPSFAGVGGLSPSSGAGKEIAYRGVGEHSFQVLAGRSQVLIRPRGFGFGHAQHLVSSSHCGCPTGHAPRG